MGSLCVDGIRRCLLFVVELIPFDAFELHMLHYLSGPRISQPFMVVCFQAVFNEHAGVGVNRSLPANLSLQNGRLKLLRVGPILRPELERRSAVEHFLREAA